MTLAAMATATSKPTDNGWVIYLLDENRKPVGAALPFSGTYAEACGFGYRSVNEAKAHDFHLRPAK